MINDQIDQEEIWYLVQLHTTVNSSTIFYDSANSCTPLFVYLSIPCQAISPIEGSISTWKGERLSFSQLMPTKYTEIAVGSRPEIYFSHRHVQHEQKNKT